MFKQTSPRSIVVIIHRYVGLTIVSFLLMAGLTGSILTFHHQLDAALNMTLFRAIPPSPDAKPLEPLILRERLVQHLSGRPVPQVVLEFQPEASVSYRVRVDVGDEQFFLDPYTGILLGSRRWGDLSQGLVNLLPFIFRLHMNLALGEVGRWLLGIVALLWTLDCFIGMYLTFPNRRTAASLTTTSAQRSWLARWKPAWFMTGNSLFGTIFTLHRASGLWAWPLLFIVAWSSVGFNLRPVYQPVMSTLFTTIDINATLPKRTPPRTSAVMARGAEYRPQTHERTGHAAGLHLRT